MFGGKESLLTRGEILRAKSKALRRGIWFRVLSRTERACMNVALIVVEKVRSRFLAKVLFSVLEKLERALESKVSLLMREVGVDLAKRMSEIAGEWGTESAVRWAGDSGFIRYLAVTCLNESLLSVRMGVK